ncbi:9646_t:CDS:10 [Acaulospora colombiana]|uniref:9646_t:CDS:1 n=1 Tax=Acaulospora colombiana TaxID=27376 RepID=A0ACA9KCW1_9GLOM|nr:9646_t:CDS:10 [Acaulospora colombiana]
MPDITSYQYIPKYEVGQFDDSPEDKDYEQGDQSNVGQKFELDMNEEDELNDNEEWDNASGDFTKHYNRLRQQLQPNLSGVSMIAHVGQRNAASPARVGESQSSNVSTSTRRKALDAKLQDQMKTLSKYANRIHIDDIPTDGISNSVSNDIRKSSRKAQGDKNKYSDKSDRATTEQVLDPRTRIILFKMINRNVIYEINGCISTGKEANVYHAITEDGSHRAIKVYKTSILIFKDRDRYVTGEFRFRHGYCKHNPRKMVKLWAEKEMRNLKRLWQAGIPCPEPLLLRLHVLVMSFLGDRNGWKDCTNITEYFRKKGVRVMNVRELFDFITDINIGMEDDKIEAELDKIQERLVFQSLAESLTDEQLQKEQVEEEVFKRSYIPRTLDEVIDAEKDVMRIAQGEGEGLIYRKLTGLAVEAKKVDGMEATHIPSIIATNEISKKGTENENNSQESDETESENSQDMEDSDDEEGDSSFRKPLRGKKNEDKDSKKGNFICRHGRNWLKKRQRKRENTRYLKL